MISHFSFILISLHFYTLLCLFISIPLITDFKELTPHIDSFFSTNPSTEAYFLFNNKHSSSDVILSFSKAFSYSTYIYIYLDYNTIQQSEDQSQYINYAYSFQLSKKEILLSKDKPELSNVSLYIIIKETSIYFHKDTIAVFNEKDPKSMTPNTVISFNAFYSSLIRRFAIKKSSPNETINLSVQGLNKEIETSISIYKNTELITNTNTNSLIYTITPSIDYDGLYSIVIASVYPINEFLIVYNTNNRKFIEIRDDKPIEVNAIQGGQYFFYSSIADREYKEEGSIKAYFAYPIIDIDKSMLKKFKVRIVNRANDADESLEDKDLIDKKSQFGYYPIDETRTLYQVLYYNNIPQSDKSDYMKTYILIYISIESDMPIPIKLQFSLGVSSRIKPIDFNTGNKDIIVLKQSFVFNTQSYIRIPIEEKYNYIVYSSLPIQRIYSNSLFLPDYSGINNESNSNQLYAFIKSNDIAGAGAGAGAKSLLVQLSGDTRNEITMTIERSKMAITYYNENANIQLESFHSEVFNSKETYYHIEHQTQWVDKLLYIQVLFGKCYFYFKDDFLSIGETETEDLLPSDKDLITKTIILIKQYSSILGYSCTIPGYIKVNFIKPINPISILKESNKALYLNPDTKTSISIEGQYSADFGIEIESLSSNAVITVVINAVTYVLDTRKDKIKLIVNKDTKVIELYSYAGVYVLIRLGADIGSGSGSMDLIDANVSKGEHTITTTKKNVMFKLDKDNEYHEVLFAISNIGIEGLQYEFTKDDSHYYVSLPSQGHSAIIKPNAEGKYIIQQTNPYDKYSLPSTTNDNDNEYYYIAISFLDTNAQHTIVYSHQIKPQYPQISQGSISLLKNVNTPMSITQESNMSKRLILLTNNCGITPQLLQLEYFSKSIETISIPIGLSKHIIDNHYLNLQLNLLSSEALPLPPYSHIVLSYKYSFNDQLPSYDIYDNLSGGQLQYDTESNRLSWEMSKAIIGSYRVYMIPQNVNETSIDNYCYLSTLQHSIEIESLTSESVKSITLPKFLIEGNNYINVIARIESPIPIEIALTPIMVIIPSNEAMNLVWLWMLLAIIVFIGIMIAVFILCGKRQNSNEDKVINSINIKNKGSGSGSRVDAYKSVNDFEN